MRHPTILLLAGLSFIAVAGEPSYTCNPDRGCREEQGPAYELGRGVKLSLPLGWRFYSYPTAPIPIMEGLREIRAVKDGMVIAVTPIPNVDQRTFSENQLCEFVVKSANQYVKQSKEKAVSPVPISRGELSACYASLTAENDKEKPFAVLPNRRHASLTTYVVAYRLIIYSISVVSEQLPDENYHAAVRAIQEIQ